LGAVFFAGMVNQGDRRMMVTLHLADKPEQF
jgi:hypothetical protein